MTRMIVIVISNNSAAMAACRSWPYPRDFSTPSHDPPGTAGMGLRILFEITWTSCISSSGRLWPSLNRKILDIALLCLRFCSIGSAKSDLNPSAILSNLFRIASLVDNTVPESAPWREQSLKYSNSSPYKQGVKNAFPVLFQPSPALAGLSAASLTMSFFGGFHHL